MARKKRRGDILDAYEPLLHWEPCARNPLEFDCSACHRGADVDCEYLRDETLRIARAESLVLSEVGASGHDRRGPLTAFALEYLRAGASAVSADTVLGGVPERISHGLSRDDVGKILASSWGLKERARRVFERRSGSFLQPKARRLSMTSGAQAARLMYPHKDVLAQSVLARAFVKLGAVRWLVECGHEHSAEARIALVCEGNGPGVRGHEGWTAGSAERYARGLRMCGVPPGASPEYLDVRREYLTALAARLWLRRHRFDSAEHALVSYRNQLTVATLPLVSAWVWRCSAGGNLQLADVFQESARGLLRAVNRYSPYMGVPFAGYVWYWIRQAITRASADMRDMVRVPVHAQASGPVGLPQYEYFAYGCNKGESDDGAGDPANENEARRLREAVEEELAGLKPSQALVMRLRYGFTADGTPRTLEEIGKLQGVTRERIRQIESVAIKTLALRLRIRLQENA